MKKVIFTSLICLLGLNSTYIYAADATSTGTTDNQLINLETTNAQDLNVNFNVQKFSSCTNYKDVMKKFIKTYYDAHPMIYGRGGGIMPMDDVMLDKSAVSTPTANGIVGASDSKSSTESSATNYSQTNIQVAGVDESEIVKSDGKNIYYYNSADNAVYIAKAYPATEMKIIKKINLPKSFTSPELYVANSKLTIVATKYNYASTFRYYWFNRQAKTAVVVYDISNFDSPKLEKYFVVDGTYSKSRKIGDYVYVLSESNFSFPYDIYYGPMAKGGASLDENKLNAELDSSMILPRKAELKSTSVKSEQNTRIKGKDLPYNISGGNVAECSDIEYVIPDAETIKKFDFTPSYVTLSIINTKNPSEGVKTKLLFGNVSETYMSLESLYITSHLYTTYDFKCPQIQCIKAPCPVMDCFMPTYFRGENTLVHKMSIKGATAKYEKSTIIPGSPLNQYSMDEKDSNFRIVTSSFYPSRSTNVFVLNKDLKTIGKLDSLAKDENFQSSRFIGDKLYLVTFKQIDPLFVINLKDPTNPTVEGELKIPGYSTYLHPYDDSHLIGLGYDTKTNTWGGTTNGGLKVDLYDIADIKNPKQQYTLTLGDVGSYSEALNNPRLFTWDSRNKLLYLPATIFTSAGDKNNPYRHSDAFQGSSVIKIDSTTGISELARVTHIEKGDLETKRKEECAKYTATETPKCEKLLNGSEYCPPINQYVPEYCYASSSAGEYFANQLWNYSSSFIIRNVYMDNYLYTLSNEKLQANDITDNFSKTSSVEFK